MFTMLTSTSTAARLGLAYGMMLLGGVATALTIPDGQLGLQSRALDDDTGLAASADGARVPLNCSTQELGTFNLLLQDQQAQAVCMFAFAEKFATTTVVDVVTSSITQETVVATEYQTVQGTTTVAIGFVDFSQISTTSMAVATSMSMTTSTSMEMTTSTSVEMSTSTTMSTSMTMSTSLSLSQILSFLTSTSMTMSTSMVMTTSTSVATIASSLSSVASASSAASSAASSSSRAAAATSTAVAAAMLGANPLYLGYRRPTQVKRAPNERK